MPSTNGSAPEAPGGGQSTQAGALLALAVAAEPEVPAAEPEAPAEERPALPDPLAPVLAVADWAVEAVAAVPVAAAVCAAAGVGCATDSSNATHAAMRGVPAGR